MGDLFESYGVGVAWDEMFVAPGLPREASRLLADSLGTVSGADLERRCEEGARSFRDRGITFALSGEERPFPLDPVPRIVRAPDWAVIESGVVQRVRALEAFLEDAYGEGQIFEDRVMPKSVAVTSRHFQRTAWGIGPPGSPRVHVSGIDLVRAPDGRFLVLEDNLRTPSGVSFAIENRRLMARTFPELFHAHRVLPVADYPEKLLNALKASAPKGGGDPTVVVLTPGVYNSAYSEHVFLARQMGVELVQGEDLTCRGNVVWMRTTRGERRVDVVYRRVDDEYLDPLHFRPNSVVGCPGIVNAARAGNVTIANAIGNGVADDKLVYTYVADMIRYYLGEQPLLGTPSTYRLTEPDQLAEALGRMDELVFKPVDGSGGKGLVFGPHAPETELDELARRLRADPRGWVAQEVVQLSCVPSRTSRGLAPRHVDLRPFAVNDGERIWVMPGGLTRVALEEGSLLVNSSQGGGSKDTWVLADDPC